MVNRLSPPKQVDFELLYPWAGHAHKSSYERPRISGHCLCPHCGHNLNKKSFKEHKRLYFSQATKEWVKSHSLQTADSSDDDLPSLPDSESDHSILDEGGENDKAGSRSPSLESGNEPVFSEAEEVCTEQTAGISNVNAVLTRLSCLYDVLLQILKSTGKILIMILKRILN